MLTEITALTDSDLINSINTAHRTLTRHKARFIISVAEFHDRALAKKRGSPNTVTWLGRHHDLSRRSAYEYLGIGTKLRKFPLVTAAFLAGRVSYSKVRLLLRYLTEDNEDELVELALRHCLSELEQALGGRPRNNGRKSTGNYLRVAVDEETGGLRLWGALDAERGTEFMAALKLGELAHLRDLADIDPAVLQDPVAVDALVKEARQETVGETGVGAATDNETPAGADADDAAAEEKKDGEQEKSSLTRFGAPLGKGLLTAFLGVVHMVRAIPYNKVRAPGAEVNVLVTTDGRVTIPERYAAESASLLRSVLNGVVRMHLLDGQGLHIKLSRSARVVSPAQEKALLARWGHRCATPGCPHSRFLEFHHIVEWRTGGATDLDNLIPLCSGCHALVTAGQTTIHPDEIDPAMLRFRLPGGESFTSTARELPVHNDQMGIWEDDYTSGPVPAGDEGFLQVWDDQGSFDDPDTGRGIG